MPSLVFAYMLGVLLMTIGSYIIRAQQPRPPEWEERVTAIKIFIDNTIYPVEIHKGQEVAFVFLPAGKQTAQGREQPVYRATLDNDTGRVINVTWQAKGMFNRLVTRHAPFLRRMFGQTDTYRFDNNIDSPKFLNSEERP